MAKAKPANKEQRARWEVIRAFGCIVPFCHRWPIEIHHTGTNAGGRKNHDKVIPLCQWHHREISRLSLRVWQTIYGYEKFYLEKVELKLNDQRINHRGNG